MSEVDSVWQRLASRVIRVALARKDKSYAELIEELAESGSPESIRALTNRISRGTMRLSLLLQVISVTGATAPALWQAAIHVTGDWDDRASAVVAAELARQPWVTPAELNRRLGQMGTDMSQRTLTAHLTSGSVPLSLFLQCIAALGSSSLEQYLDFADLHAAANFDREPLEGNENA